MHPLDMVYAIQVQFILVQFLTGSLLFATSLTFEGSLLTFILALSYDACWRSHTSSSTLNDSNDELE